MCSFHKNSVFASILPLLLIIILTSTNQASTVYLYHFCTNETTYTPNSTYQANLNTLLSSFSSNSTRNKGFYNSTAGRLSPNIVYGFYLCRGDVASDVCHECVSTVSEEIVGRCPKEKVAVIWYDECMLRYADRNIFSTVDEMPAVYMWNAQNITVYMWNNTANIPDRTHQFQQILGKTMYNLANRASNPESSNAQHVKWFATESVSLENFQTLYGLVQCTPDLSGADCSLCLGQAVITLPQQGISEQQGGRVLTPSCNIRFEMYSFFSTTNLPSPSPSPSTKPRGKKQISTPTVVSIVAPTICLSLVLFGMTYCFMVRKLRRKNDISKEETVAEETSTVKSLQFDFGTIEAATNNFSSEKKIGEGGFGEIYKGVLTNGQEIAVKRLSKSSGQGLEEFKNEVSLVAKLQHRNLARILGFCLQGVEKILIYEYIPNKSLDYILFDPEKQGQLDWSRRHKIIDGIARGLLYLHEDSRLRIIHRDLKASNILLDTDMNPKISDFGMARIFQVDQTQGNTSRIVGTYGYMSPEYAMHGEFSVKSDVFSFGVIVLEMISGKKTTSFYQSEYTDDLLCYAWKLVRDNTPLELMDPSLKDSYPRDEVLRCIHIGLLCVQEDVDARPSMASVLLMLNNYSVTMPFPQQPPFFTHNRTELEIPEGFIPDQSTMKSMAWSVDESEVTGVYPR